MVFVLVFVWFWLNNNFHILVPCDQRLQPAVQEGCAPHSDEQGGGDRSHHTEPQAAVGADEPQVRKHEYLSIKYLVSQYCFIHLGASSLKVWQGCSEEDHLDHAGDCHQGRRRPSQHPQVLLQHE